MGHPLQFLFLVEKTENERRNNMYTAIVAEDDSLMRSEIVEELVRHSFDILGEAPNGETLIELVKELQPEVIFVDVDMPKMNGILAATYIKKINPDILIIFITSFLDYGADAFDIEALDYVVKPFNMDRFDRTVRKIKKTLKKRINYPISVKVSGGFQIISNQEIIYIESKNRKTHIFIKSSNTPIVTLESLTKIESRLNEEVFVRTHRSYIVNINYIDHIESSGRTNIIYLKNTKNFVYLSPKFLPIVFKKFN